MWCGIRGEVQQDQVIQQPAICTVAAPDEHAVEVVGVEAAFLVRMDSGTMAGAIEQVPAPPADQKIRDCTVGRGVGEGK